VRFGDVPLDEAEGAVLAHSVQRDGLRFKKGRVLGPDDLESLRERGVETVIAARLEPGDVPEDEAATRVARALVGDGLRASEAFTGRVNLHATGAGVAVIDKDRVDRINRIDESVTVGTLPAFEPVQPKRMVATIKIIPFAVAGEVLEACLEAASGEAPAIGVAPYRRLLVKLIQTQLPGVKDSVLDKTVSVTARRISAVGGHLGAELRCPHRTAALAEAIGRAGACDLLLIAGASAITDRRDVLPAAIEAAGGRVEHCGMPVDPGNLLLLGRIGGRPVLGLPGCARSPKLNGFDWVLQRLAAGLEVGRSEIMAMGVGGLLTEIPSRPQPREARPDRKAPSVAAVVLAGGQSRRMGSINKLLAEIGGKPMLRHVALAAVGSKAKPVVVVTGHDAERVEAALAGLEVRLTHNPDYAVGLSTSLRAGLRALPDDVDGALVCLGDMPRLTSAHLDRLIAAFEPSEGRSIVVPTVRGKRGNPVLWARAFFEPMLQLEGDVGARHLIGEHHERVVEVAMEDDAALTDVDTRDALARLTGGGR
jgi:molybdenum cofactor cytidylyltransferase